MPILLTDTDIHGLLAEPKPLAADYRKRLTIRPKRGHKECELDVEGANDSEFRLYLRQSNFNTLDFSVILAYRVPGSSQILRLRRYNGKSHEHTNTIEEQTFYDFHIHTATERYQDSGLREDTFAEVSDRYSDLHDAIDCMIHDCGFEAPPDPQTSLFDAWREK